MPDAQVLNLFKAAAYNPNFLFGREGFEGGTLPASFTSSIGAGNTTAAVVKTYDVVGRGANCVQITNATGGTSQRGVRKDLGSSYTELWIQVFLYLPPPITWNTQATFTNIVAWSAAFAGNPWYTQIESPSATVTISGDTAGYHTTAKTLSAAKRHRVEYYVKISATVGQLKLWINNTVAGSPDYDSGIINTGTAGIQYVDFGMSDSGVQTGTTSPYYFDDCVIDTAFIGSR
jgi:hypothetical protein